MNNKEEIEKNNPLRDHGNHREKERAAASEVSSSASENCESDDGNGHRELHENVNDRDRDRASNTNYYNHINDAHLEEDGGNIEEGNFHENYENNLDKNDDNGGEENSSNTREYYYGENNSNNENHSSFYTQEILEPGMFHTNAPQFNIHSFGPHAPPHPSFSYHPHHPSPMAMNMMPHSLAPPTLPPPPSMCMPSNLTNVNNNNNEEALPSSSFHLDATRQYYEARMREHAMQYANAAAGAAWAAARIASGLGYGGGENNMIGMGYPPPSPSEFMTGQPGVYHVPPSASASGGTMIDPSMAVGHSNEIMATAPPQQQRALWHPPSSSNAKNKGREGALKKAPSHETAASSGGKSNNHNSAPLQLGKKRSKKRESGNDSVSSFGSKSRDHDVDAVGNAATPRSCSSGGRRVNKKCSQRRRFNEDDKEEGHGNGKYSNTLDANHRHKRGLHHGSSKGSTSSPGSNAPQNPLGGRNKKQNRSQSRPETPTSCSSGTNGFSPCGAADRNNVSDGGTPSHIFLGGLIGKSGVSALHELCSKFRWEMPSYNLSEPQRSSNSTKNDNIGNTNSHYGVHHDFVLSVCVNGVELGRGRGGTKASAKQDASRKALASMVPGVIFDPNGILLDVGSGLLRGKGVVGSGGSSRSQPTSLEELAPHLASQLAIGGNLRTRAASPDPSEDSSISTAVSMTKMTIGAACNDDEGVISGGPIPPKPGLRQHQSSGTLSSLNAAGSAGRSFFSPNIYPCASTTSGVSSASEVDEDEDENAYYASRGASVCSTLLHAMWQIDDRIREPPSYTFELGTFDLCPSPVSISLHGKTVGASNECSSDGGGTTSSKGKEFKVASSKRKAMEATAHRLPFQCTSSLTLYFSKHQVGDKDLSTVLQFWESPLEYLQTKDRALSSHGNDSFSQEPRRKRKDSQSGDTLSTSASQSPNRRQQIQIGEYVDDVPNSIHNEHEKEEYATYKLESVGTGSTKREAKHKASAKMLGMLFPECCNLVEVKAAAEAARECYAAQKQQHQSLVNQTKRAKLTESEKGYGGAKEHSPKNPKDRESEILGSDKSNHLSRFLSVDGEAFLPRNEINSIKSVAGLSRGLSPGTSNGSGEEESFSEGVVSVASLSLSEPLEDTAQVKWGDLMNAGELSCNTEQHNFEIDVDAALQSLQDVDEEGCSASTDLSIEGKFILRRANSDDSDCVHALLSKNEAKSTRQNSAKKQRFSGSNGFSLVGPMGLLSMLPRNAIILLLSRAVAPHEEPPLGCAVLTLSTARRVLNICDIAHEKILPKERFMDCLTVFAEKMKCTLDNVGAHRHNRSLTVSSNKMMSIVRHYVSSTEKDSPFCDDNHNAENVIDSDHHETGVDTGDISPTSPYRAENDFSNHAQGNSPHNYLQSVKEEDSAEEDDRSEDEDRLDKSNVESSASAGRRRCKPGKRTRVS